MGGRWVGGGGVGTAKLQDGENGSNSSRCPIGYLELAGGDIDDKDKDQRQEWDPEGEMDKESKYFEECLNEEAEFWEESQREAQPKIRPESSQLPLASEVCALLVSAS